MLHAQGITVRYGERTAVRELSFHLKAGEWLMLLGPNGAGKSSLLRALAQSVRYEGSFTLKGADLRRLSPSERARMVGFLSQHHSAEYAYSVEEIVSLGRYARRRGFLAQAEPGNEEWIDQALAQTGMTEYRHSSILQLSGGELQRTFLAQVLAQDPALLVLDEPANHLDLKYQQQIFDLIADWLRSPGRAVVSVVHDLSLARAYGTHVLLMHEGGCVAQGAAREVLTPELLERVYEMDVDQWMQGLLAQWKA